MDKKTADKNLSDRSSKERAKGEDGGTLDGDGNRVGTSAVASPTGSTAAVRAELSVAQQQLLMKFYDQECYLLDAVKARLLLRRNQQARVFLAEQGIISGEVAGEESSGQSRSQSRGQSSAQSSGQYSEESSRQSSSAAIRAFEQSNRNIPGGSLWPTISLGISQEKRLRSVSLGAIPQEDFPRQGSDWIGRLGWGVSGACVAAGAIFVAVNIFDFRVGYSSYVNRSTLGGVGVDGGVAVSQGLGNRGLREARGGNALSVNERRLVVMEGANEGMPVRLVKAPRVKAPRSSAQVEWVRSNGKPTFIRDPRQGAPIIWIKRIPKVMVPPSGKTSEDWNGSAAVKQAAEPYADFE